MAEMTNGTGGESYMVVVEWDGDDAPRIWYRRLHRLTGGVRGDGTHFEGPVARRRGEGGRGVILQEGAIYCSSESLARTLAFLAEQYGARQVSLFRADPIHLHMEPADRQIVNRVNRVLSKKGRKPKAELWSVTCLECARVSPVEDWNPLLCPECASPRVHNRRGQPYAFTYGTDWDHFTTWNLTRFAGPHWEPAEVHMGGQVVDTDAWIGPMGDEKKTVETMNRSSKFRAYVESLDQADALALLDAVFLGRTYHDPLKRQQARIAAVTKYFTSGGDPARVVIAELPDVVDVLDASLQLGTKVTVGHVVNAAETARKNREEAREASSSRRKTEAAIT